MERTRLWRWQRLCFWQVVVVMVAVPRMWRSTANFEAPTCALLSCTLRTPAPDGDGPSRLARGRSRNENSGHIRRSNVRLSVSRRPAPTRLTLTATRMDGDSDDFSREVTVASVPATATRPPISRRAARPRNYISPTPAATSTLATISRRGAGFDDGTTSPTRSVALVHGITTPTTKHVTLTVTDENGGRARSPRTSR